jgi:hypothetical protein
MKYQFTAFLFFLFVGFGNNVFAQRFDGGVIAGLSTSQVDGDTQKDYKKLGFYSGVYVETEFNKVLGAKIELFYITKGAKKVVNDIEEFNTTLHYVEMPFLITIKPVSKFEFDVGFALSYLISSKLTSFGYEIKDGLYDMHDMDFGGIITGSYFLNEKLGINVRFEYSVKPVKTDPHNWYNSNLSFGVVYKIL